MTRELVIVLGMMILYLCSFFGLITAWVYYRKYKRTVPESEKTRKSGA